MNTTVDSDTATPDPSAVVSAAEPQLKSEVGSPPPTKEPTRDRSWRSWLVAILVIIVVAALIAVGAFVTDRGAAQLRDTRTRIDALRREIDDLAQLAARMRTIETQAAEARQAQQLVDQQLARDLAALNRTVQALDPDSPLAERDFVLADVEYLVLAANQRLALEHDVGTALAALTGADERLRSFDHPDLLAVRERLAADIAALRGIPTPDHAGLALYLGSLQTQLASFPLRAAQGAPLATSDADPPGGWRGVAARIWRDLLGLVEIRDATPGDRLTFDPVRQGLIRESLRLELATARLAVMQRDSDNLRGALTNATTLLDDYFDRAAPTVSDALDRLRAMQGTELRPNLSDLGPTLDAIRALRSRAVGASPITPAVRSTEPDVVTEPERDSEISPPPPADDATANPPASEGV